MAPEQLADSKRVDPRCDLDSLGVVLFKCLAGEPPFTATSTAELALQIVRGEIPAPQARRGDLPPELTAIVARCMRRRPRERFPDARAVRGADRICPRSA